MPNVGPEDAHLMRTRGRIDYPESRFQVPGEDSLKKDRDEKDELDKVAKTSVSLDLKDYLALAIASIETIFLPLLILMIVFLAILFLLR